MFERKKIVAFVCLALVIYTVLVLPWPSVPQAYRVVYLAGANSVLGFSTSTFQVYWIPLPENQGHNDIMLAVVSRQTGEPNIVKLTTRLTGYVPTVELVALVLATSIPWSRKWKALLWGLLGVHAYIALRLASAVLYVLSSNRLSEFFTFTPMGDKVVGSFFDLAMQSPTISFGVPVFIWIVVTLRKGDFEKWRNGVGLVPR